MKWILFLIFFSLNADALTTEPSLKPKASTKSKERLREAQRSLASVDPALKPIQIRKMKAKPLYLIVD